MGAYMQKLKLTVLDRMMSSHLTSNEVNFILYISRFQDEAGRVCGVYYKDACKNIDVSIQGYYDILNSLQKKGIITFEKKNYFDCDVQINDNDFSDYDYDNLQKSEGYLKTNYLIFTQKSFLQLKANEKLLAMDLLKNNLAGRRSYRINTKLFYEKYTAKLGVTKRVIARYLTMLRLFFSIGIVDHIYYFTPLKFATRNDSAEAEIDVFADHEIATGIRRQRIKEVTQEVMADIKKLFTQYQASIKKKKNFDFSKVVQDTLEIINEKLSSRKKHKWRRDLNAALIHRLLRTYLGIQ